jgi:hypothetical protein
VPFRQGESRVRKVRVGHLAGALVFSALLGMVGCRRQPAIAPVPSEQGYCWWTAQYLAVAPAWVASRFENALSTLGLGPVRKEIHADSAWASGGPSLIPGAPRDVKYGFQAIAYSAADSVRCAWRGVPSAPKIRRPVGALSCFRTHWYAYAPSQGWAASDSINSATRALSLCAGIYKVALAGLERLDTR